MDATLSYGQPRINASGTLLEGIGLWGELKPLLTHEAVKERALAYCDWAASMGLLAIRTHVDVCDDRLLAVEALLEVKKEIAHYIDLQLVAFPQDGLYRSPTAQGKTRSGRSISASMSSVAFRISNARWPMVGLP
jgi:cytosine deaminase